MGAFGGLRQVPAHAEHEPSQRGTSQLKSCISVTQDPDPAHGSPGSSCQPVLLSVYSLRVSDIHEYLWEAPK